VDDQPAFVAAKIKDDAVVIDEIEGATELPAYRVPARDFSIP
jgi:hypothetical protein